MQDRMLKFGNVVLFVLLSVAVISPWLPISVCAKKEAARKEDIPYIKCQVCEKLSYQLYHQVQSKQADISPNKMSEYQIIEITENVCNLKKQEGDWILKIDIVEQGDRLELVEQESEGQCNSECKTIERACQEPTITGSAPPGRSTAFASFEMNTFGRSTSGKSTSNNS